MKLNKMKLFEIPNSFEIKDNSISFLMIGEVNEKKNTRLALVSANKAYFEMLETTYIDASTQDYSRNFNLKQAANKRLEGRFRKFMSGQACLRKRVRSIRGLLLRFFYSCSINTCKIQVNKLNLNLNNLFSDLCNSKILQLTDSLIENQSKTNVENQSKTDVEDQLEIIRKELSLMKKELADLKFNKTHVGIDVNLEKLEKNFQEFNQKLQLFETQLDPLGYQHDYDRYKEYKLGFFSLVDPQNSENLLEYLNRLRYTGYKVRKERNFDEVFEYDSSFSTLINSWYDEFFPEASRGKPIKKVALQIVECGLLNGIPLRTICNDMMAQVLHWHFYPSLIENDPEFLELKYRIANFHLQEMRRYDPMKGVYDDSDHFS